MDNTPDPIQCANPGCPIQFLPRRKWARFCSNPCRHSYHTKMRRAAIAMYETYHNHLDNKGDDQ
jgi:hypothetical protein